MEKIINTSFSIEEMIFLKKWLGKIVDRGDLSEEIEEDNEERVALELYKYFDQFSFGKDL